MTPGHITIQELHFRKILDKDQIAARISALGEVISRDYKGKNPLVIVILNGAFIFAADLLRHFTFEAELSFVRLSSYHNTSSTGTLKTIWALEAPVYNRHVLIIEDIVDTGKTLYEFHQSLLASDPASVETAAFLLKPDALQYPVHAAYTGFSIPDHFVVGYGMDYNGRGRHLADLYQLIS